MVLLPMPMTNHKAERTCDFQQIKDKTEQRIPWNDTKQEKKFRENGRFGRSFDMLLSRK